MNQSSPVTILEPHRTYLDHLAAGRLAFQRCGSCRAAIFYPRVLCPSCGSLELDWEVSAGRGTVYATTVVSGRDADYVVCLVDLDEGFRLMTTVLDLEPGDVSVGGRVRAVIQPATEQTEPRVVMEVESTHDS